MRKRSLLLCMSFIGIPDDADDLLLLPAQQRKNFVSL